MPTATAIGGPAHGRTLTSYRESAGTLQIAPSSRLKSDTWPWREDPVSHTIAPETYVLQRYLAPGWRVPVKLWIHEALVLRDGPMVPLRLLPEILWGLPYEYEERRR